MKFRRMEALLALTTIVSVVAALARWQQASVSPALFDLPLSVPAESSLVASDTGIGSMAREMSERNPFRLSNRPSRFRHGETPASGPITIAYRPQLTVAAVVGGPPWTALLGGVPGVAGMVLVRPGDVVDSIHISSIARGRVVVRLPDTTWVLELEKDKP